MAYSRGPRAIHVEYQGNSGFYEFPYKQPLVEAIKLGIAPQDRAWHPTSKVWEIRGRQAIRQMEQLLREHLPGVDFIPTGSPPGGYGDQPRYTGHDNYQRFNQGTPPPRPATPTSDHGVLFLAANAPIEVVHAAYRALAKKYHPDIMGAEGTELMKQLNAAYDRLKGGK